MTNSIQPGLYIGLISGTSMDGVDAALCEIDAHSIKLLHSHKLDYDPQTKVQLLELCQSERYSVKDLGLLNRSLGKIFAEAAMELLAQAQHKASDIVAIGSHGQTAFHYPESDCAFSLQLGDPSTLCYETNITTVADFRNKDMAAGGQGAPLVPHLHDYLFRDATVTRVILNIGGISNITLLPNDATQASTGFDTGPGNTLLDQWIHHQLGKSYDQNGDWSDQGQCNNPLLNRMLADPYFAAPSPKSTGREYFNLAWLKNHLQHHDSIPAADIQRTLVELTTRTILDAIKNAGVDQGEIYVCGGGVHNAVLMASLRAQPNFSVATTEKLGLHPDWVEAAAFAWFASKTLAHLPSNVPSITGANKALVLGGIYYP